MRKLFRKDERRIKTKIPFVSERDSRFLACGRKLFSFPSFLLSLCSGAEAVAIHFVFAFAVAAVRCSVILDVRIFFLLVEVMHLRMRALPFVEHTVIKAS